MILRLHIRCWTEVRPLSRISLENSRPRLKKIKGPEALPDKKN